MVTARIFEFNVEVAVRWPCWSVRMWLSSVVFPAPTKPVMIVTGVFRADHRSTAHCGGTSGDDRVISASETSPSTCLVPAEHPST